MKYLIVDIPILVNNQYKMDKMFVGVAADNVIITKRKPREFTNGATIKAFEKEREAAEWAKRRLSKASNIAAAYVFDNITKKSTRCMVNFTLEEIMKDEVEFEANAFVNSPSFPGYLHNRLSQLTSAEVKKKLLDADDIRKNRDSRMIFFVDLYEDNSEQLFIADSLDSMKKHLNQLFNTTVYWIKLQHSEIPTSKSVYWGHIDNGTHVILYKL